MDKIVAIVQSIVPSYREDFFALLMEKKNIQIYTYLSSSCSKNGVLLATLDAKNILSFKLFKMLFVNIIPLLSNKNSTVVLSSELKSITNWFVLLFARFFNIKVILWGHGVDARYYDQQVLKMPFVRVCLYRLADGAWFYTEKEKKVWDKILPRLRSVALMNTVHVKATDVIFSDGKNQKLKEKLSITTKINFIFCARFSRIDRRADLLINFISNLDSSKFGLIVIGDGAYKPNFSLYSNIYDFGSVYDAKFKSELFAVADVYFQPACIGLSVVEAMAYSKPIFTLKRSDSIMQGVEYSYIEHNYNGMLFECIDDLSSFVTTCDVSYYKKLGTNARIYYDNRLSMQNMVNNAVKGIDMLGINV
jgi:hypothetical protein